MAATTAATGPCINGIINSDKFSRSYYDLCLSITVFGMQGTTSTTVCGVAVR